MNVACRNGPLKTRGILANSITGGNSHERTGKTDIAADGRRRFYAGAMHAALLSFRAHGRGECAPLPSKFMAPASVR